MFIISDVSYLKRSISFVSITLVLIIQLIITMMHGRVVLIWLNIWNLLPFLLYLFDYLRYLRSENLNR